MQNRRNTSNAQKNNFVPYREDGIFSFSTSQHAAISLICERAMEHIGATNTSNKTFECIISKPIFANRYKPLYRQVTNFIESSNEDFEKYFKGKIETIRNYFSHYKISTNNIENLLKNDEFCQLCELLQTKSVLLWKEQHEAYLRDTAKRKEVYENMSKEKFELLDKHLTSYFDSSIKRKFPNFRPSYFFLFISIFVSRSEMFQLCNALHTLKIDTDKDNQDRKVEKESYRELLTILSLRESHDVFAQNDNYIVALTTLNHFAMQFGHTKDKDGVPLKKEPKIPSEKKELPEICKYHSSHFFLKMAIAFIETNNILPKIKFARFGDYKLGSKNKERIQPSWEEKDSSHELFIRNNSIPIQLESKGKYLKGQLGISALTLILQTWVSLEKEKRNDFIDECTRHIKNAIIKQAEQCKNSNYNMLLPKSYRGEINKIQKISLKSIESKKKAIEKEFLDESAPEHKKARFIIWWILRKMTVYTSKRADFTFQAQKDEYEKLLIALLDSNWQKNRIAEFFPSLTKSELSFVNEKHTLPKLINSSKSLKILFGRIKSDFLFETNIENTSETKKENIAKLLNVRNAKANRGNISSNYSSYLSGRLSPNADYFLSRDKSKFNLDKCKKRYLESDSSDLFGLLKYYKADMYKITHSKARDIYQRDMLLIEMSKKTLTEHLPSSMTFHEKSIFDYAIKLPIENTHCSLIINGEHQRKLYNYLSPTALQFIIKNYWKPKNNEVEIPLHINEEKKSDIPRSFFDCVQQMEQERRFLIEVFLEYEKSEYEIALQNNISLQEKGSGDNDRRVELHTILESLGKISEEEIREIKSYRNYTFHQVPQKPFADAPEPVKTLFHNKIKEREEKRQKQKRKGIKNQK